MKKIDLNYAFIFKSGHFKDNVINVAKKVCLGILYIIAIKCSFNLNDNVIKIFIIGMLFSLFVSPERILYLGSSIVIFGIALEFAQRNLGSNSINPLLAELLGVKGDIIPAYIIIFGLLVDAYIFYVMFYSIIDSSSKKNETIASLQNSYEKIINNLDTIISNLSSKLQRITDLKAEIKKNSMLFDSKEKNEE